MINYISCIKNNYNYKACFTTNKDTFQVNEKIWFKNCSLFDGGSTICLWNFGEAPNNIANSNNLDSISFTYTSTGFKNIILVVGDKENNDEIQKSILIQ